MRHALSLRVGPIGFRIGSAWGEPIRLLRRLYAAYPQPEDGVADYTVRLEPAKPWRRWVRPSVEIGGDYWLPDAAPLPLAHALLAAEMGMNLQLALGHRRHLLLHAASLERDGRALILTGESGAGKSTLAALLGERGWRLMGDEFALLDPTSGLLHPFPRLVSLKNEGVTAMAGTVHPERLGPLLEGTPKGGIRHLVPRIDAIVRMDEPVAPALILFPRFGHAAAVRPVDPAELFVRLTQASPNYVSIGERGFAGLTRLISTVPAQAVDYPNAAAGIEAAEQAWRRA